MSARRDSARAQNARGQSAMACEIVAAGHAYPTDLVDNETFFQRCRFPITDDRAALIRDTRMKVRTWCTEKENTWTLARDAVQMALRQVPDLRDEIDVVLVTSATTLPVLHPPDAANPGMADLAPMVLRELGRSDALGLDVKACYCTGFLRGLQVMDGLLTNQNYGTGLVIATEQGSRMAVAETNRSKFCFIMADAAGAVVLRKREKGPRVGILDYLGGTDASKLDWVGIGPDGLSTVMRGARAGEATLEMLVGSARTLLARNGLTPKDVDWLIPLQTHAQIADALRQALEWPPDKFLWFGDRTGLSGSASIAASLSEQIEKGVVKKKDLILSVAVGAGMNFGGALYYY